MENDLSVILILCLSIIIVDKCIQRDAFFLIQLIYYYQCWYMGEKNIQQKKVQAASDILKYQLWSIVMVFITVLQHCKTWNKHINNWCVKYVTVENDNTVEAP